MRGRHRYTLPLDGRRDPDLESARLFAAGAVGVWITDDRVIAWFDAPTPEVAPGGAWVIEEDRDWQEEWKSGIGPVTAGRVTVVPTWLVDGYEPRPDEVVLVLDPGRAFGSGHHATTCLCLELLQEADPRGRSVLDVGTGTGVLAIAAAKLGARSVLAVDVDDDAVVTARENVHSNGVTVDVEPGSLEVVDRESEIVLANLTSDTLVELGDRLVGAVAPHGTLIASGIAVERAGSTLGALTTHGLRIDDRRSRDGWTAVRAVRSEVRS